MVFVDIAGDAVLCGISLWRLPVLSCPTQQEDSA